MCSSRILQVKRLMGINALMSDGRTVRLGPQHRISCGDYLEVYADIAVTKVESSEAKSIQRARQKKGVSV